MREEWAAVAMALVSTLQPVLATAHDLRHPINQLVHVGIKLIVVRDGSLILSTKRAQHPISVGDAIVIGGGVLYSVEPEGKSTVTIIHIDPDYALDLFYWQHTGLLRDRFEAREIAAAVFTEPTQMLRLGEQRFVVLAPWLDELMALSSSRNPIESFARMQALWFQFADAIRPLMNTAHRMAQLPKSHPRCKQHPAVPVRIEALTIQNALQKNIAHRWLLRELAEMVHLSTKQLARVFTCAYGVTPDDYLGRLRVEAMARMLREGDLPVAVISHRVGWSRNHATERFVRYTGVTPSTYRRAGLPSLTVGIGAHLPGDSLLSSDTIMEA